MRKPSRRVVNVIYFVLFAALTGGLFFLYAWEKESYRQASAIRVITWNVQSLSDAYAKNWPSLKEPISSCDLVALGFLESDYFQTSLTKPSAEKYAVVECFGSGQEKRLVITPVPNPRGVGVIVSAAEAKYYGEGKGFPGSASLGTPDSTIYYVFLR